MIWGQVGITVGPMPDSMPDCLSAAADRVAALDKSFAQRSVFPQNGRLVWRSDVTVACGYFNDRPAGGTVVDAANLQMPK
jgi:hypothetical protein